MNLRRVFSTAMAAVLLLPTLTLLSGCKGGKDEIILRIYNWEEYIDEGGEGAFIYDELHDEKGNLIESDILGENFFRWYEETTGADFDDEGPSVLDDFELWYEKTYKTPIHVEYSTFGTNEDMYNEIVLGNKYDLLCPSDYMIMKLAAEGRLETYDESFFDESDPNNYYIRNVSPYIRGIFETNAGLVSEYNWSEYAAGDMWGTTGFVYNPEYVDVSDLEELGWKAFTSEKYTNKITAKDNVRDTYFAALGLTYQDELLSLDPTAADYRTRLTEIFNKTDEATIAEVEPLLMELKSNIYSFETDTGKADMVSGKIWLNYAWSGDAVYALDLAETTDDEGSVQLNYYVPEAGSNLYFDGWVMPKGANKQAAQAFVNFMSMPYNAMRNSYYIGYTSVISGENFEMLDYTDYLYGLDEDEADLEYDLTYFFLGENYDGEERVTIFAEEAQATSRQLYAQFPPAEVIARCAVMDYYDADTNTRINELWSRVKAETLDAWAIAVICVAVAVIALFIVFVKFGSKIDFFRTKPKKGYELVKQEQVTFTGAKARK